MWLAPPSAVLPTELPVNVFAWIAPAVWSILRPAPKVTVLPVRVLARIRSEFAPLAISVRSPAPPLADGASFTVKVWMVLKAKSPPLVNAPSVATRLAPSRLVLPAELPLKVSAVMMPLAPSLIAPAEVSVVVVPVTAPLMIRSPAVVVSATSGPPSSGPSTVSVWPLVRLKSALKLPSMLMWLLPSSVVLPTE